MPDTLSAGATYTMVQNQVYALPSSRVFVQSSAAVEVSQSVGSGFAALTGANTTGVETAFPFIRCTTVGCTISVKKKD